MYSWELAAIDAYKPLDDATGWRECPLCHELPRVWEFNNGRFARCRCRYRYEASPASAESIMDVVRRTGDACAYDGDALRVAWNRFVEASDC